MLKVSELFLSISGEGPSMGKPAIFLRLAGCNLNCRGFAGGCDTLTVWKHGSYYSSSALATEMTSRWRHIPGRIIITGGEPTMQAEDLLALTKVLDAPISNYYEIETNGTIWHEKLMARMDQINVSPKLLSSGASKKRYNEKVLIRFSTAGRNKVSWKFVVQDRKDIAEIKAQYEKPFDLFRSDIWLMPAGIHSAQLNETAGWLAPYCAANGYNYSDRLQIRIWGNRSGV